MAPQILLLLSAILHASWNTATKTVRDKDSFIFLTIFFSCPAVAVALLISGEPFRIGGSQGLAFAVLAGFFEAGYLYALARGFSRTSLAKAYAVMRGGAMVVVWIVSLALGLEPFSLHAMIGSVFVLVGIVITGLSASSIGSNSQEGGRELFWPLLGAVFIAGYHLCYGESLKFGAEPKALFSSSLSISLPALYFVCRDRFWERAQFVLSNEKFKLLISTVGAALGFVIFLYGLKESGPGYAMSLRNSSIFFSIGFSFLIRDSITKTQIIGATIVGIGAMVLSI